MTGEQSNSHSPTPPKAIWLRSQHRSRIMHLRIGSVNRSLQLICRATLALPCRFLERWSRFVAELMEVRRVDGFGNPCKRLLLEIVGAARICQVNAAPCWGNEYVFILRGVEPAAQTTAAGSLPTAPQLLLDTTPSASPEPPFNLLQPWLFSSAVVNSLPM